jgi:hypothetical protein
MQNRNYFEILEIQPTTDINQVKKAFRKQMMRYHPDKNGDIELCKRVVEAGEFLIDQNNLDKYYESVQSEENQSAHEFAPSQEHPTRKPEGPSDSLVSFGTMLTIFIPMFAQKTDEYSQYQIANDYDIKNMRRDEMLAINPYRFKTPDFDFNALTEIMNYVLEVKYFKQIGLDIAEVKAIVEQHSWYHHYGAYFGVRVKVNVADITERFSELDISPNALNGGKKTYLSIKQGTQIEVKNLISIHLCGCDNTGLRIDEQHGNIIYKEAKPTKKDTNTKPMLALLQPVTDSGSTDVKIATPTSITTPLIQHGFFPAELDEKEQDVSCLKRCIIL